MPQSTDVFKAKFNAKLREITDQKGTSSRHLTTNKNQWIIGIASNPNIKKSSQDYRLLNRYEILHLNIDGVTTKKLKERGSNPLYVSIDIFDAIHTEHLSAGHGGRDVSHVKVSELYANITRELITIYVDLCETCLMKKRKVRKSLVVRLG